MATQLGNEKVAKRRSVEWKKKLAAGKLEARIHPTQLRVKRVSKYFSQSDIATKVNLSIATYGAIERGFRVVKPDTAKIIAELLGASTKVLFKTNKLGKLIALDA
jgi:DNA-binding XRE family transcriptional regulator